MGAVSDEDRLRDAAQRMKGAAKKDVEASHAHTATQLQVELMRERRRVVSIVEQVLKTEPAMRTEIGYLTPESVERMMLALRAHL